MNEPKPITLDDLRRTLAEADRPLTRRRLSAIFDLDKAASDRLLKPLLVDLVNRGEVVRNRRAAYGLAREMDLVAGRISAHADGFGFVIPDAGGDDLYLSPRQMRQVFNGDRVLAAVTGVDRRGRKEGGIVEVVERAHAQVVGRLMIESGVATVVPDDPRLTQDILIPLERVGDASPGQIVVARIERPPSAHRGPVGELIAVLGQADEPGIATDMAVFSYQLPAEFPDEVADQAKAFGDEIDPDIAANRVDLRQLPLVTIDGADARDFDDAVYAEPRGDGYRLIVAIADVAEYVQPESSLDTEACQRGTSVYFPDRVIPMLPEALSNGLCSLNPEVDRLCLVCDMKLDDRGKVLGSRFYEAVLRSHARMTYDQVERIVNGGDADLRERFAHVLEPLEQLYAVYLGLARRRQRRGALDFDSQAVYFQFDAEGRVADIRLSTRHDAHRLIEECMIAANVEAARFVGDQLPMLYRVHEPPQSDKLEALEEFLRAQGLSVRWKDEPEPAQFAAIQNQVADSPLRPLVNAVLLRSLSLAVYQPENRGHFGLALASYAHFTSPIRRYPDLLLHRAIKHLVRKRDRGSFPYGEERMAELGRHCSWTERRAEEAARDVDERLKAQFMQRHLGDTFDGIVTGVTSFGLFVELPDYGVSGLVHVTALPNDYYHFDPVGHSLTGKRRGIRLRLADRVRVELAAVNVEERKIDLRLVEDSPEP
ncbi:ribonuclease R [Wenzhouxiangella limi]|uniref:Ribonuclease R n=1 Tax=Wenzhouxiangella limi TaxID=2707351 RepID=A0A845UXY4_9GAMM|nr:ribonuclease R [Wenzhouxiangella limi]NDY94730.1 ribonuclease R [Wenzhouxiangella limi]